MVAAPRGGYEAPMSKHSVDLLGLALGGFVSLATFGCSGGAEGAATSDIDGDGVSEEDGDCDDQNRLVHPGADEVSRDGLDSNCDDDDLPVAALVWSLGQPAEDNVADALEAFDADGNGAVSLAEFGAACEKSAYLSKEGRAGVVQVHASCAGTNSCRGMVYQQWNELYEHTCRGVNNCAGWSCVEMAPDEGRSGEELFAAATCDHCHTDHEETHDPSKFKVPVTSGEDPDEYVVDFWESRSDDYLRSIIAFGIDGVSDPSLGGETPTSYMPGSYQLISRGEMDTLISHLRTLEPYGSAVDPLATPDPIE